MPLSGCRRRAPNRRHVRALTGLLHPFVDPSDQIVIGDVANEEEQAIGGLAEAAVAQRMALNAPIIQSNRAGVSLRLRMTARLSA